MKIWKFNIRLRIITGFIASFFFILGVFFSKIKSKFEKYQMLKKRDNTFFQRQSFKACSDTKECYLWDFTNLTNDAHIVGRDGAGLLSFHDTLWLIAGWNSNTKSSKFINSTTNEILYSIDGLKWDSITNPIPWEPRHSAGYLVFKDKIWILGGDAIQYHYQNDIWNSSDGKNWTKVADSIPWGNRVLYYSAVFKGRIWVIGGQSLNDFIAKPNRAFNEKDVYFNDIWSSEDGIKWQKMSDSSGFTPRCTIVGNIVFNNKLWMIGGGYYQKEWHNDVCVSDDGVKWTVIAKAPWEGRIYNNTFVFDNKMWVFGGHNGKKNLNDCWYSEDGINWHELKNMNIEPRHAASVAEFKNHLYIVGGDNVDSLEVWKISSLNN